MRKYSKLRAVLVLLAGVLAACDSAENTAMLENDSRVRLDVKNSSAKFGPYIIQVNAMLTADLTPEIAQGYGIVRSPNQAMVNLVVLSKEGEGAAQPIGGNVSVSAANLNGQLKNLQLREINELGDGASIYYIGLVSIDHREIINFDFDVQPEGSNQLLLVRYTQEFYTK